MADLKNTTIDDTGFLELPSGTTAQRPSNPQAGMIRWNTDVELAELYNGTEWGPLVEIPIDAQGGSVSDVSIEGVNYRIHAFTSTGTSTFTVNSIGTTDGEVDALIVGGGGAGGNDSTAGGAGGLVIVNDLPVVAQSYEVEVGAGGLTTTGSREHGFNGGDSSAFDFDALGGGGGGGTNSPVNSNCRRGLDGGSGGSNGRRAQSECNSANAGQSTQDTYFGSTFAQGFGNNGRPQGRSSGPFHTGGAGGAGGLGQAATSSRPGDGGPGLDFSNLFTTAFGEDGWFAGGGGGTNDDNEGRQGGIGGGGFGGTPDGGNGMPNTGGGGGGFAGGGTGPAGLGGSGIVLIRYRIG